MLEQQSRRPVKVTTAARRLSTGTYTYDVEHYFAVSATNPVSTSNYHGAAENQHRQRVKVPTAIRRDH